MYDFSSPLSDEERLDWLRLIRADNVGPVTFCQLMARYGSAQNALTQIAQARPEHRRIVNVPSRKEAAAEIENLQHLGARLITKTDKEYPHALLQIPDTPPILTILGDISLLQSSQILAIVGARNASISGKTMAKDFATALGNRGWKIASGMACGIDAQSHEAAVRTGTIAVLAGGIDDVYPQENQKLYDNIRQNGVIISESPLGQKAQAHLFPRRNRLIAGLARGVLVIEAGAQSGSLRTAQFATDYNRDVFVVPGHPHDPRSKGSNLLIQQGHQLVQSPDDMIKSLEQTQVLEFSEPTYTFDHTPPSTDLKTQILHHLSYTPVTWDALGTALAAPIAQIRACVVELEMDGRIHIAPGGRVSLQEKKDQKTS